MRAEDKEVEGRELAQGRQSELEREDEEEMPELEVDKLLDWHREGIVIGAMRAILEHRQVVINDLRIPQREIRALEALKAATGGRDGTLDQFVYASDRREMLEQALAVLQPELVAHVDTVFDDLVFRVGALRHELKDLEDAQDELLEGKQGVAIEQDASDTADKPEPDGDLYGPELAETPKPPSALLGPELEPAARPASTLGGPGLNDVSETPAPASTLGDPAELAAASERAPEPTKKPWWRRPFGG